MPRLSRCHHGFLRTTLIAPLLALLGAVREEALNFRLRNQGAGSGLRALE